MLSAQAMPPVCAPTAVYQRRQPTDTVLYRTVEAHLETFLAHTAGDGERSGLPGFVKREFEAYLRCGVLAHGFVRVRCDGCALERLVPFSCKGRGFCPSCGGRRMAAHAAQLVEAVLARVSVRQWVLTDRGLIREGLAADLVIFDPDTIVAEMPEVTDDLPAGTRRLVQRCRGVAATVVNGEVLLRDGKHTGALPGRLLRGPLGRRL